MTIRRTLYHRRAVLGWTQSQLARKAKVSRSEISMIETGATLHPLFRTVARLCKALGIELDEVSG